MKAKKSLGQHFLTQPSIASRIAASILDVQEGRAIAEVGPGKGMLTQFLLERFPDLIMIETDLDMIEILRSRFPKHQAQILHADFLRVNIPSLFDRPFYLVGNFPYNISSQILFKMLDYKELIPQMVGMFQKEVADRIASRHGSKTYGILSVLLQTFYSVEILFTVPPQCFSPPPKVQSAVVRLMRKDDVYLEKPLERTLRQVVKLAFNQRRKMLRNSLKTVWPGQIPQDDPVLTLRPEQLSVDDFLQLSRRMISLS
jgi:16S rRNA (adenine1518-N6/adenine1519-N6)-dimethyltransferase